MPPTSLRLAGSSISTPIDTLSRRTYPVAAQRQSRPARADAGGAPIQRVGFLLKVRPDRVEEYKRHHEAVRPDMLDALRRHGWRNYSLFIRDDGTLFGYLEAHESFSACLEGMEGEDANRRWQELMAPFFEIPSGARPDQAMVELQEVFHLD